jgi:hypothetical protein
LIARRAVGIGLLLASLAVAAVDVVNPFFVDVPWIAAGFVAIGLALRERVATGAALAAAAIWAFASLSPSGPAAARVVVYGVDGATFDILDSHSSELPNFTRLRSDGASATLMSMDPMFSPLLWTTIASGRTPAEHGIRGFHVQSSDCKVARFWDVAENAGMRIGLYKWLVDYPPRKVPGFWVPSWLAPAPEAWPPALSAVKEVELSRRLRRKQVAATHSTPALAWSLVRDGVRLSTLMSAVAWSAEERLAHPSPVRANVAMQMLRGRMDRDVFVRQLYAEKPDLATFTYYATDGLAHLYWDRYDKGGDELLSAYRQADDILGEIRAHLSPDARLIVVSDHGFKAMDGTGLAGQFAPLTERLQARLVASAGPLDVSRLGHKLTIGLHDEAQRAAVTSAVNALADGQGQPFYRIDDVPGELTVGLTLADEQVTAERLKADTVGGEPIASYVQLTDAYTGTHDPRGIFFAAGPGVTPGARLDPLALLDVAPTVLAAAGLPAAENMPGKAAIFPEQPRVASWDDLVGKLVWLGGEDGVNEEQLKALGYIQ